MREALILPGVKCLTLPVAKSSLSSDSAQLFYFLRLFWLLGLVSLVSPISSYVK